MKEDRPKTKAILIEIKYADTMNAFECNYGDNVSYQELEQRSYIEFKELIFTIICRDIKFRKYGRIGQTLTIKADMLEHEVGAFLKLLDENKIELTHDWEVINVIFLKDNNLTIPKQESNNEEIDGFNEHEEI